jgi:hypothetical protein
MDTAFALLSKEDQQKVIEIGCTVLKMTGGIKIVMTNGESLLDCNEYKQHAHYLQQLCNEKESELNKLRTKYTCNNVEKGIRGEQSVIEYIQQQYDGGELVNTTKSNASGDMIFRTTNDNKIMIEVKNKQSITNGDILKFERDVKETQSNGGVFVVTTNVKIPLKGKSHVDFITDSSGTVIPLFYFTNFEENPHIFNVAMKTVEQILAMSTNDHCENLSTLRNKIDEANKNLQIWLPIITESIQHIEKGLQKVKKIQEAFINNLKHILS